MVLANLRDRAAVEWDELESELVSYGRAAYMAAMRELGYTDMIERGSRHGKGGGPQKRCEEHGCHVFATGRYCPTHTDHRPEHASASRRAA